MGANKHEQDILRDLFQQLPREPLSRRFNDTVMDQILTESSRKKKRNERLTLLSITLASVLMIALVAGAFYYLEIDLFTFRIPALSSMSFGLLICLMVVILLLADYKLRQIYFRNHPGSGDLT